MTVLSFNSQAIKKTTSDYMYNNMPTSLGWEIRKAKMLRLQKANIGQVKRTILHLECWWGAHLPFYGREPVGG